MPFYLGKIGQYEEYDNYVYKYYDEAQGCSLMVEHLPQMIEGSGQYLALQKFKSK